MVAEEHEAEERSVVTRSSSSGSRRSVMSPSDVNEYGQSVLLGEVAAHAAWKPLAKQVDVEQNAAAAVRVTRSSGKPTGAKNAIAPTAAAGKRKLAPKVPRAPRKRPKRKTRTSEVRRNEINLLQKESKYLEAQIDFLRHRSGVHDQQRLDQQVLENALFREFQRNQKYLLAGLKSAVATDSVLLIADLGCTIFFFSQSEHSPSPLSTTICLGSDHKKRREYLLAIKPQKVHDARQFLAKRTQFHDMTKPLSDVMRIQAADGCFCASKLDVIPLYYATSVKQVYDTLLYYALNAEISAADINGDVVIREELETGDESVSQNRFVFLKKKFGVQVETNNAIFCQFTPEQELEGTSDEGMITIDFIDEDELYPYRPSERMRDNATNVFSIKSYRVPIQLEDNTRRQSPKQKARRLSEEDYDTSLDESDTREVVVLTRWFQAKFQPSTLDLPVDMMADLRDEMSRICDAVLTLVRSQFRSPLVQVYADQ